MLGRSGVVNVLDQDNRVLTKYDVPYGATMLVADGARLPKGEIIYEWDPYNAVIISEHAGVVRYVDLKENVTYREIDDEQTGHIQKVVIDSRDRTLAPQSRDRGETGSKEHKLGSYIVPTRAHLAVNDGQAIALRDHSGTHSPRHRKDARYHGWSSPRHGTVRGA